MQAIDSGCMQTSEPMKEGTRKCKLASLHGCIQKFDLAKYVDLYYSDIILYTSPYTYAHGYTRGQQSHACPMVWLLNHTKEKEKKVLCPKAYFQCPYLYATDWNMPLLNTQID